MSSCSTIYKVCDSYQVLLNIKQKINNRSCYSTKHHILLTLKITFGDVSGRRKDIRDLQLEEFFRKVRNSPTIGKLLRTFKVPKLNFDDKCYIDLINWQATNFDPLIHE